METFSTSLAICVGNKGQWSAALMLSLICAWIHGWENNRGAGDLRRHLANYDVTVMCMSIDTQLIMFYFLALACKVKFMLWPLDSTANSIFLCLYGRLADMCLTVTHSLYCHCDRLRWCLASAFVLQKGPSVFSIVHDDITTWQHFPHYWPFVRIIHLSLVDSPQKGPVTLGFDDSLNKLTNTPVASDLSRRDAQVTSLEWSNLITIYL